MTGVTGLTGVACRSSRNGINDSSGRSIGGQEWKERRSSSSSEMSGRDRRAGVQ